MIQDEYQLRPRYGEVDSMGYVYHANYVNYCHQARTEMFRKMELHDAFLEKHNIILPVVAMELSYLKPAGYDELLTVKTVLERIPKLKFLFEFSIYNAAQALICEACTTVVCADIYSRKPMRVPNFMLDKLLHNRHEIVM